LGQQETSIAFDLALDRFVSFTVDDFVLRQAGSIERNCSLAKRKRIAGFIAPMKS
jgi:hypothetical protein